MTRRYRERSLLEFQQEFSTEESCVRHLREMRWADGFRCPQCGHPEAWFIRTRNILDCKSCRAKISLTAGTIFHKTRVPLLKWYWLIYHMAMDKVGVSISEMQRVVDNASASSIEKFLERLGYGPATQEGKCLLEVIRTDGWRSYGRAIKDSNLSQYKVVLKDPKTAGKLLPWVHRVISNAKAVIRGSHRGVSEKHLQLYLSEICYRFNRRFWEKELFDRLIKACVSTETITYSELIKTDKTIMN